jgi:PhzF family phenazine biosynthesis protein
MECGAGVLSIRTEGEGSERLIFTETPEAEFVHEFSTSVEAISSALGVSITTDPPPTSVNNGPTWLFAQVDDDALSALRPDMSAVGRLSDDFALTGIAVFALRPDEEARVHIRCFAPSAGVPEDPVTGSANAALPTYLSRFGLLDQTSEQYKSTQGKELGRDGRVHVRTDGKRTQIGGQAITVIDGEIRL